MVRPTPADHPGRERYSKSYRDAGYLIAITALAAKTKRRTDSSGVSVLRTGRAKESRLLSLG